jgi:plasmid stabilization system protein ParE
MRELISTYPYIIRYHIDGDKVVILRVRHTARRPTNPSRAGQGQTLFV